MNHLSVCYVICTGFWVSATAAGAGFLASLAELNLVNSVNLLDKSQ